MIVSIHQPQFMPWLGYFDKIAKSDVFVFLDDVQFKKNEWQNRNKIKSSQGSQWLTVPVLFHFPEKINEVKINNQIDWRKNHLHTFTVNYSKAKAFNEVYDFLGSIYSKNWDMISDLNIESVKACFEFLGITKKCVRSSEIKTTGSSTERLVDICLQLKAGTYLSGAGGRDYLDESKFNDKGIKVIYQSYEHPVYQQCFNDFIPRLSALDIVFNFGKNSKDIFLKHD